MHTEFVVSCPYFCVASLISTVSGHFSSQFDSLARITRLHATRTHHEFSSFYNNFLWQLSDLLVQSCPPTVGPMGNIRLKPVRPSFLLI